MKKVNRVIVFFLILILFVLLTYITIDSAQGNVTKIGKSMDIEKRVDLHKINCDNRDYYTYANG